MIAGAGLLGSLRDGCPHLIVVRQIQQVSVLDASKVDDGLVIQALPSVAHLWPQVCRDAVGNVIQVGSHRLNACSCKRLLSASRAGTEHRWVASLCRCGSYARPMFT